MLASMCVFNAFWMGFGPEFGTGGTCISIIEH